MAGAVFGDDLAQVVASGRVTTAHVLGLLRSREFPILEQAVLLAVGALTDEALMSPDGYVSTSVEDVARLLGWAPGDIQGALMSLVLQGVLVPAGEADGTRVRVPESVFER